METALFEIVDSAGQTVVTAFWHPDYVDMVLGGELPLPNHLYLVRVA